MVGVYRFAYKQNKFNHSGRRSLQVKQELPDVGHMWVKWQPDDDDELHQQIA